MTGSVLVTLGHGYAAARLAASLSPGWRVLGTTRSAAKAEAMRMAGVEPVDWADAGAVDAAIAEAGCLLAGTPPDGAGDPVLLRHGAALAAARPDWVGYLSTTGVYGDRQGGWVDEDATLEPVGERGRRRVAAEAAWLATGLPVHVFRVAGIYGPGRSAFDRLREGRAQRVVKPGQVFSRIHVTDLAAVLRASMAQPVSGRVYNVADDLPAPPQDVVAHAARLLGIEPPPEVAFEDADLGPMARSFWDESKRAANRRIREELGVALAYPDYRAGLAAILAAGG
jgi:nucleoside-diphosphate-sugar epimerase